MTMLMIALSCTDVSVVPSTGLTRQANAANDTSRSPGVTQLCSPTADDLDLWPCLALMSRWCMSSSSTGLTRQAHAANDSSRSPEVTQLCQQVTQLCSPTADDLDLWLCLVVMSLWCNSSPRPGLTRQAPAAIDSSRSPGVTQLCQQTTASHSKWCFTQGGRHSNEWYNS